MYLYHTDLNGYPIPVKDMLYIDDYDLCIISKVPMI